jgi:hypothetical protein
MIRLYSTEQALALRGTIPELTITRSLQFQSDGYDSAEHGHIIVIQEGDDDLSRIPEIGPEGLFDADGYPTYEYIEVFTEDGRSVYEVVFQIDDSRTVTVIIPDEPWLDPLLRSTLEHAAAHH